MAGEIFYRGYTIKPVKNGYRIYNGKTVINPANTYPLTTDAKVAVDKKISQSTYGS